MPIIYKKINLLDRYVEYNQKTHVVLIAKATSEGSDETALVRAFPARIHKDGRRRSFRENIRHKPRWIDRGIFSSEGFDGILPFNER